MSIEQLAVNAVSDRVALCPHLNPEISHGDKTPITDGFIDFFSSKKHSKKTLDGRVPVQVKGRVTKTRIKASREHQNFQVEREVLEFFRKHGGGVYFYVPMREDGSEREIFYAILLPFKIDRLIASGKTAQKTFSLKLTRLPPEAAKLERIVRLAWTGRVQSAAASGNGDLMSQAESLHVHSLAGLDETRPTRLSLTDTDCVVVAQLSGGIEVALDIDLEVLPGEYVERQLAIPIRCGDIEFTNGFGRRLDETTHLLRLSDGLEVRLWVEGNTVRTTIHLTRSGSFREQAKDFDFLLAAASGNPLVIGDFTGDGGDEDPALAEQLTHVRAELTRFIELFDHLGVDDARTSHWQIDEKTKRMLLALHEGVYEDRPVRGTSDGTGRFDVPVANNKIMVIVMPAEEEGHRRVIDPFDPSKRDRFRIYQLEESGPRELDGSGTIYEAVVPEDMAAILNLRLHGIVDAYEALKDRPAALVKANLMVLRLLSAADLAYDAGQRENLISGASTLCSWLMAQQPESLIHLINWWQIQHRLGALSSEDRKNIRAARRALEHDSEQATLQEACLLILLGDDDELELVLSELSDSELTALQSWPVWALRQGKAAIDQR